MTWISVKDRLPEVGDYSVLCAFSNGSIEPIRMEHVEDWAQGLRDDYLTITHWMPLPDPPKEEEVRKRNTEMLIIEMRESVEKALANGMQNATAVGALTFIAHEVMERAMPDGAHSRHGGNEDEID